MTVDELRAVEYLDQNGFSCEVTTDGDLFTVAFSRIDSKERGSWGVERFSKLDSLVAVFPPHDMPRTAPALRALRAQALAPVSFSDVVVE